MIWDQIFTVGPDATSSDGASSEIDSRDAFIPDSLWCRLNDVDWMAEVLREEWSWF